MLLGQSFDSSTGHSKDQDENRRYQRQSKKRTKTSSSRKSSNKSRTKASSRSKKTPTDYSSCTESDSSDSVEFEGIRGILRESNSGTMANTRKTKNSNKADDGNDTSAPTASGTSSRGRSNQNQDQDVESQIQKMERLLALQRELGITPGVSSTTSNTNSSKRKAHSSSTESTQNDQNDGLMAQMEEDHAIVKSKNNKKDAKKAMQLLIREVVRGALWRGVKIPYGKKQQEKACNMVIPLLKLPSLLGNSDDAKAAREKWKETYKPYLIAYINAHRGYVQSQIKKVCWGYMAKNGGKLPSKTDMVLVLKRELDMENENHVALFEFYWEKLLVKGAGCKYHWDAEKRHYEEISKAAPPNTPAKTYITPSTEAFVVVTLESNRQRWELVYAKEQEYQGKRVIVNPKIKEGEEEVTEGTNKEGEECVYLNDQKYLPLYTKMDQGQSKDPSWTKEGRDRFSHLVQLNKDARATDACIEVESAFLEKLRTKLGLKYKSLEEENKAKRRKVAPKEVEEEEDDGDDFDDV